MPVVGPRVRAVVLLLLCSGVAAHVVLGRTAARNGVAQEAVYVALEVAAVALCAARVLLAREDRAPWTMLTAYTAVWAVGDLLWIFHYNAVAEPPFPNWADAAYLPSYLLAYVGQTLLLTRLRRHAGGAHWLDGLVAGLTAAALCAALAVGPTLAATDGSLWTVVVTLAYPTADLVLLGFVAMTFAVTGWRPGRQWTGLTLALLVTAIADVLYSYGESAGTYVDGGLVDVLWPVSMVLVAWSAWQPAAPRRRRDLPPLLAAVVPSVCSALALGVIVAALVWAVPLVAALLAVAALATGGVRAAMGLRENARLLQATRAEALTDGLTGLPNRRRLMADLEDVATAARADVPATLLFLDLDGFKAYNDGFGHQAGDALLARLGRGLAAATANDGTAYRLGGDEFCVVVPGAVSREDALVRRALAALAEQGDGFAIGASLGTVVLPADARTAEAALQLADTRMYEDKSTRGGRRREARDLVLTILKEREPDLEQHVGEVAALALSVGRRLGMSAEELDEVGRGAELHDVGKLAVPDSILHKPGPLDPQEWHIMRQHTVIGERILMAAPALQPVARLVRASHERWDGGGYPDGLAGDAIPLGARIIAACDALHAMTERRPYTSPRSLGDAVDELRRCAGTQFDPVVVGCVADVLADHGRPAAELPRAA